MSRLSTVAVLLFLSLASLARAATLDVPAQYLTIGAALAAAAPGDSVAVAAGSYSGSANGEVFPLHLTVDQVSVIGAGIGASIIDAENSGSVFLIDTDIAPRISGFSITGGRATGGGGVAILAGSPEIDHNLLIANGALKRGSGINVRGTASPHIHHNVVWQSYDTDLVESGDPHGIQCGGSSTALVEHNLIGLTDSNGLFVLETAAPTIRHNIFMQNGIDGVRGRGICSFGTAATSITHNLFFHNSIAALVIPNPGGGFINQSGQQANDFDPADLVYGNIDGDPLLNDAAGLDFGLISFSPAIDAGEVGLAQDPDGTTADIGPFYFDQSVVAIPPLREALGRVSAAPNPFNPRTTIRLEFPEPTQARVILYDLRGRALLELDNRLFPAGLTKLPWDGTDARGRPMASGVYLVRASTAKGPISTAVALIR